jgi:hypothetical protein
MIHHHHHEDGLSSCLQQNFGHYFNWPTKAQKLGRFTLEVFSYQLVLSPVAFPTEIC